MEKMISFTCDVNVTRRNNAVEDYCLKSEYGHFNVFKYTDCGGQEIVRTISFPSEGRWYLITAGKFYLAGTTSLDIVFCIDGEVKIFAFEENIGFDVPINQAVDSVLDGSFDIAYEELPDLIEELQSGFVPPEQDAEENLPSDEEISELDGEVLEMYEEVPELDEEF